MTAHQEIIPGAPVLPLVPRSIEETWRIAVAVMKAGIAPDGVDTPEKALIILMHGLEVGFTPMAALQSIALINKKPVIWGDGALALVRSHRDFEWIKEQMDNVSPDKTAICAVKRRGEDVVTRTFSWSQAGAADLTNKAIWKKYPDRMLQMRARAFALRDAFADAFKGLGIREEVMDYDMPRNAPKPPMSASKGHTATPGHPEVTTLPGAIPVAGEGDLVEKAGLGFSHTPKRYPDSVEGDFARELDRKETVDPKTGEVTEEPSPPVKVPPRPPQPPRPPSSKGGGAGAPAVPTNNGNPTAVYTPGSGGNDPAPSHPMGPLSAGLPNDPGPMTGIGPVGRHIADVLGYPRMTDDGQAMQALPPMRNPEVADPGPIPPNLVRRGTVEALAKQRPDFNRDPIVRIYEYIEGLFKMVQTFDEFENVCERYIDPFVADIPNDIDRDGVRGFILEYEQRWAPE